MAVQHNKWSQFEHEGHLYRVRLIDQIGMILWMGFLAFIDWLSDRR